MYDLKPPPPQKHTDVCLKLPRIVLQTIQHYFITSNGLNKLKQKAVEEAGNI